MDLAMDNDDEYSLGGRFLAPLWRFLSRFAVYVTHDPTTKWVRSPGLNLVVDLDKNTLSGVAFCDPVASLSFLGKCDDCTPMMSTCHDPEGRKLGPPEKSYSLSYCADGLGVSADSDWKLEHFLLHVKEQPPEPRSLKQLLFKPYMGKIVSDGRTLEHSVLQDLDSVINTFGTPDEDRETPAHDVKIGKHVFTQPYSRFLEYQRPHAWWAFYIDEAEKVIFMYVSQALPTKKTDGKCPVDSSHA